MNAWMNERTNERTIDSIWPTGYFLPIDSLQHGTSFWIPWSVFFPWRNFAKKQKIKKLKIKNTLKKIIVLYVGEGKGVNLDPSPYLKTCFHCALGQV
jgi:hypothetical protein